MIILGRVAQIAVINFNIDTHSHTNASTLSYRRTLTHCKLIRSGLFVWALQERYHDVALDRHEANDVFSLTPTETKLQ